MTVWRARSCWRFGWRDRVGASVPGAIALALNGTTELELCSARSRCRRDSRKTTMALQVACPTCGLETAFPRGGNAPPALISRGA